MKEAATPRICAQPFVYLVSWDVMSMKDSDPCHRPAWVLLHCRHFHGSPPVPAPSYLTCYISQNHKYRSFSKNYPSVCINPYSTPTSRNRFPARYRKSYKISFIIDFRPWLNTHELPPIIFFSFPTACITLHFLQWSSEKENELKNP